MARGRKGKKGHYRIVLEGEHPLSLNKFYAGMNRYARNSVAKSVHTKVCMLARSQLRSPIEPLSPVRITVTCYFAKRPYDPDNIMAKLYIDGLAKAGIIPHDGPKVVREVRLRSRIDRENPRLEIEVEVVPDGGGES